MKVQIKCENCGHEHDGSYGSGRFCSVKCARGFSTKENREQISQQVSQTLKGQKPWHAGKQIKPREIVQCVCGKKFERIIGNKRKFCSIECSGHSPKPGNGGLRDGGGHSKTFSYKSKSAGNVKLNKEEIEVAKIFDKLKIKWQRNTKGFSYTTLTGKQRKYYPDFYLHEYNLYVEYKGWVTYEMMYKMEQSQKLNNIKLLIIYGEDKRYSVLGLNLKQLKESPKLLFEHLEV